MRTVWFPISRDPPEGGTNKKVSLIQVLYESFQFLGIPPKGELTVTNISTYTVVKFPISRDPPEGGTHTQDFSWVLFIPDEFPISRDPPEGGTTHEPQTPPSSCISVSNF